MPNNKWSNGNKRPIRYKSMNAVVAIRKHYIRRQTDGLYKTVVYTYIKINLSFTQSSVTDSQIARNSKPKTFIEINTITKFLLFKMKYVIGRGCLIIDIYYLLYYPNTLMNL